MPREQKTYSSTRLTFFGPTATREDKTDAITYDGDEYVQKRSGDVTQVVRFRIVDATARPKQIDYTCTEGRCSGLHFRSIYTLDGDDHEICSDDGDDHRPKVFSGQVGFHRVTKRGKE
jgi:uncharacterized protein (TIGR03067 family)